MRAAYIESLCLLQSANLKRIVAFKKLLTIVQPGSITTLCLWDWYPGFVNVHKGADLDCKMKRLVAFAEQEAE